LARRVGEWALPFQEQLQLKGGSVEQKLARNVWGHFFTTEARRMGSWR
jgi:hypothetical protein